MISEDYVSSGIAKLLKEKGFDEEVLTYYVYDTESKSYEFRFDDRWDNPNNFPGDCISAPTLQMVMKWLRKKHLVICIIPLTFYGGETVSTWGYNIWADDNLEIDEFDSNKCATYEEACEVAIRFCIEKLI